MRKWARIPGFGIEKWARIPGFGIEKMGQDPGIRDAGIAIPNCDVVMVVIVMSLKLFTYCQTRMTRIDQAASGSFGSRRVWRLVVGRI